MLKAFLEATVKPSRVGTLQRIITLFPAHPHSDGNLANWRVTEAVVRATPFEVRGRGPGRPVFDMLKEPETDRWPNASEDRGPFRVDDLAGYAQDFLDSLSRDLVPLNGGDIIGS